MRRGVFVVVIVNRISERRIINITLQDWDNALTLHGGGLYCSGDVEKSLREIEVLNERL